MRQGMASFGGIAPTYHIELLDRLTRSDKCKNQYNIYKSRAKDKNKDN